MASIAAGEMSLSHTIQQLAHLCTNRLGWDVRSKDIFVAYIPPKSVIAATALVHDGVYAARFKLATHNRLAISAAQRNYINETYRRCTQTLW